MNNDEKTSPHDVITSDVLVNVANDGSIEIVNKSIADTASVTTTVSSNHEHDQNPSDNGTATTNTIYSSDAFSNITAVPVSISISNVSVPITCSTQTITNRTTTTTNTRSINDIFINKMPFLKKTYRKSYERTNSAGKAYQTGRRVSFPENDSELVTGYLEPANPWATGELTLNLSYNMSIIE